MSAPRGKGWILTVLSVAMLIPGIALAHDEHRHINPEEVCGHSCWVMISDEENFEGELDTLCGPFGNRTMEALPGARIQDWDDDIESLQIGPAAELSAWEDDNYEGDSRVYRALTVHNSLEEDDMDSEIGSVKLLCNTADAPVETTRSIESETTLADELELPLVPLDSGPYYTGPGSATPRAEGPSPGYRKYK